MSTTVEIGWPGRDGPASPDPAADVLTWEARAAHRPEFLARRALRWITRAIEASVVVMEEVSADPGEVRIGHSDHFVPSGRPVGPRTAPAQASESARARANTASSISS